MFQRRIDEHSSPNHSAASHSAPNHGE
jgi:hypothetical protein